MATVKIELELDWLSEEESLDEAIRDEVLKNLQNRLIENAEKQITAKLNGIIEGIASNLTDSFIEETMKAKIEDLQIPYKESSWDSTFKLIPISEFIGIKYERYLNEKTLDRDGNKARYSGDGKLSISEYFINNYLEKELTSKVSAMIQTARKDAEETVVKALENNLKEQLSVDIINRLNIPKMLESLQNKAAELGMND
ncbi:hypothetical protein M4D55_24890 [Metabacillus idriensis]|uniref:hypothetical protein n=1 Tax=Metabacillus idriensis TaxID=324768 RepID=UPI001748EDF8|nr:hypothetical protein [Metabacillus idriensis]MCM3598977.1 hypothetical protein [Metabacillus idriensis]